MGRAHYTELPPWERAGYYRRMAQQTEALGENGSPEFRQTCREYAARWRMLANELMTSGFEDCSQESAGLPGETSRRTDWPDSISPPKHN